MHFATALTMLHIMVHKPGDHQDIEDKSLILKTIN